MQYEEFWQHITEGDEISWQAILFDAVKREEMDPWDVDISVLSERFMGLLEQIKDMNLRLPGKVILASAILLKLKSMRFLQEDMSALDRLIASAQEPETYDMWEEPVEQEVMVKQKPAFPALIPKTPQPRTRKVSVYDLVKALEKALEVRQRRKVLSSKPHPKVELPNQLMDLSMIIQEVHHTILKKHENKEVIDFTSLTQGASTEEVVLTFIPLLHLCNMRKIDLHQQEPFGDIHIEVLSS
ncbi:MAG: segregation/condensation protein A [Candidatus Woesearchaeota archaeon]